MSAEQTKDSRQKCEFIFARTLNPHVEDRQRQDSRPAFTCLILLMALGLRKKIITPGNIRMLIGVHP